MSNERVDVDSDGAVLAGEIWLPPGDSRAGVVLIGGSGPADRTNDGYFDSYRSAMARRGFAGVWYDKRGVGRSTGNLLASTLDDLATDALAVAATLTGRIGAHVPVGLFGHSEGGWVALRAAARSSAIAFVVTNSCPGVTPCRQDRHALAEAMLAVGISSAGQVDALQLYDELIRAAAADRNYSHIDQLLRSSRGRDSVERYVGSFDEPAWMFWKRKHDHDPIPDHGALRCPHLAIFGSADPLVPVCDSISEFTRSGCDPTRTSSATVTLHVVPGADHRILHHGRTAPDDRHIDNVSDWITAATHAHHLPAHDGPPWPSPHDPTSHSEANRA